MRHAALQVTADLYKSKAAESVHFMTLLLTMYLVHA